MLRRTIYIGCEGEKKLQPEKHHVVRLEYFEAMHCGFVLLMFLAFCVKSKC